MTFGLRLILITASILMLIFVIHEVKKAKMQVFDSVVWILFSVMLVLLGLFPDIAISVKKLIGIESTVNCIFLFIFLFVIVEVFSLTVKLSKVDFKVNNGIEYFSVMENLKENKTDNSKIANDNIIEQADSVSTQEIKNEK